VRQPPSIAAAIDLGTQTLRSRERQVAADGRQRLQSPSRGLRELTHSGTDRRLLVIGLPASNGVKPVATGEHGGHRAETWMPRRAGPVESPTRCPYDNEGRSASAVESRPSVAAPRLERPRRRRYRFAQIWVVVARLAGSPVARRACTYRSLQVSGWRGAGSRDDEDEELGGRLVDQGLAHGADDAPADAGDQDAG
jgi:hypothetical protein